MHNYLRTLCWTVVLILWSACTSGSDGHTTFLPMEEEARTRSTASFGEVQIESPLSARATVMDAPEEPFWVLEYAAGSEASERISVTIPNAGDFPEGEFDVATHRVRAVDGSDAGVVVGWMPAAKANAPSRAFSAQRGIVHVERLGSDRVHVRLEGVHLVGDDDPGVAHTLNGEVESALDWSCEVRASSDMPGSWPVGPDGSPLPAPSGVNPDAIRYVADTEHMTAFCKEQLGAR